jgi:hypothetical protein
MGEIYKITDGTSSIDISPIRGQNEPESRGREVLRGTVQKFMRCHSITFQRQKRIC